MSKTINDLLMEYKAMKFSDISWLKEMIKHHEMAIKMSEQAVEMAKHSELKQLAKDIIKAQSYEINKMKSWLKDWD
jgi:uncharacterized protein (DUF305 family)